MTAHAMQRPGAMQRRGATRRRGATLRLAAWLLATGALLAACGSNDASTSLASARDAAKSLANLKPPPLKPTTPSPSGTTVPSAIDIIDSHGDIWTVVSGSVFRDGVPAATSIGVTLLLYYDQVIYQHNLYDAWWSWKDGNWMLAKDPRPPQVAAPAVEPPSPSGTHIPAAARIIDTQGNVWTVAGGAALKNGAPAATSVGVKLLLYYDSVIYHYNMYGAWWSWNGSDWVLSKDPRPDGGKPP